jgi:P27 family predicted phage terminase small subunit
MPAPKSAQAKALAGEKRPSRLTTAAAVEAAPGPPEPPPDLSGLSLEIWRDLAPKIWEAGYLVETDAAAFAILCGILATEKMARQALERDGLTTQSEAGTIKGHPALRAAETARAQARAYLEAFALTPSGRQKIDPTPTKKSTSRFAEFLS